MNTDIQLGIPRAIPHIFDRFNFSGQRSPSTSMRFPEEWPARGGWLDTLNAALRLHMKHMFLCNATKGALGSMSSTA